MSARPLAFLPGIALVGLVAWWLARPTPAPAPQPGPERPRTVRVAAVQFHSVMGDVDRNRRGLAALVRRAAAGGAKLISLPEAAVSGYADLEQNVFWSSEPSPTPPLLPASSVAETVDGESCRFFSDLTRELGVFLTVPFVETASGKFYNSAVLLGPDGTRRIHYRKQFLWTVADPYLVLANWTFPEPRSWRGPGGSRVIGRDGEEIARVDDDTGDRVVLADLPARR
ncbi:hypothetical protein HY251_11245 [bacterium]|nr:hypothetical protein [bacterium]